MEHKLTDEDIGRIQGFEYNLFAFTKEYFEEKTAVELGCSEAAKNFMIERMDINRSSCKSKEEMVSRLKALYNKYGAEMP